MDIAIDPQFSVFGLVERVQKQSTLLNHRRTMSLVSYEIENATIVDGARTRVFSGFQYFSKFLPQVERYQRLAARAESVYVFGVPDIQPPAIENVIYIPLSANDQLSKEWFLISYGADYYSALATEELTHITDPDENRVFKGVWTFDLRLVSILEEWLSSVVDAHKLIIPDEQRNLVRQIQLMSTSMGRITNRLTKFSTGTTEKIVHSEVQQVLEKQLEPALNLAQG